MSSQYPAAASVQLSTSKEADMQYVFPPHQQPVVPVANRAGEFFPVHRIYCVGRNYAKYAIEMGGSGRDAPFFFMKPADSVLPVPLGCVGEMPFPSKTQDLQHEIELVVAIGKGGREISAAQAMDHVWGFAIGLDMTRRDLQVEARRLGGSWCTAKGFDFAAPISPIHPKEMVGDMREGRIFLHVNGVLRQDSNVSKLIWNVPETIEQLSRYFTLQSGDLIFTGSPEGVGAVKRGDLLEGGIEKLGELRIMVWPDFQEKFSPERFR